MKDNQIAHRLDIYPELEKIATDWMSCSIESLLEKYWNKKKLRVDYEYDNPIAECPCINKGKNVFTIHVCDKSHLQDYKLQLGIALINSCKNCYDMLPNLDASDDDLWTYRPKPISTTEAIEAKKLLKYLPEN